MPFVLDNLGVFFFCCNESIRLKIKCPRPKIFFQGTFLTPYINPLEKHLLLSPPSIYICWSSVTINCTDNIPFALDDLGVIFRKESIRLKIKCPRPQIFFPGGISTPYINPLKKKNTCYPPSTSFESLLKLCRAYLKIALDNMPFALDDLGVIFCKESIGLKKNVSRPQIFFPGVVSDPLFLTPWKKHLLPSFYILFSTI